jgi:hypothetical protein
MSQDLSNPQPSGSEDSAVVQWGNEEPVSRGHVSRLLAAVGRDRRLVPMIAGLGLVALFASLAGEWVVISVPNSEPAGGAAVDIPTGVSDAGNLAMAYLLAVLAVVSCTALVLFGSPAIRRNARVIGLALCGAALALLVAVAASLEEVTPGFFVYYGFGDQNQVQVRYGRGLVAAFLAVTALAVALHLAGRSLRAQPDRTAIPGAGEAEDSGRGGSEIDWPWRRPRTADREDAGAGPIDLTVAPARPFALPEQQDGS